MSLSMYDLLLPPYIEGLKLVFVATSQNSWECSLYAKIYMQFYSKVAGLSVSCSLTENDSFSTIYHGFC